jgi:biotin carboxylase
MSVIAIVDAFSTGSGLSRMLAERGVELIHIASSPTVMEYFRRTYRHGDFAEDLGYPEDDNTLLDLLRARGVHRVVAGTESGVILADSLAARLGCPANSPDLVRARRDKLLMARAVAATGLSTPHSQVFTSVRDTVEWYETAPYDQVVVKPVDSAGTDNVWFCDDKAAVRDACARVLATHNLYGVDNRRVLVQERLSGTEVYVNTVSHDGLHRVAEMWRYTKRPSPAGTPIYDYEEPIQAGTPESDEIRGFVFAVLDALGIRSSAAHTELMLTDRGPVLIEAGARLGGATLPDVVQKLSGVSQTGLLVSTLLDPAHLAAFDDRAVRWRTAVRNVSLINAAEVVVRSDDVASRLARLPTCTAVAAAPIEGAILPRTVDLLTSPGYLYLSSEDPAEVERDYRTLREWEQRGLYA